MESDHRPSAYETPALPLSYIGLLAYDREAVHWPECYEGQWLQKQHIVTNEVSDNGRVTPHWLLYRLLTGKYYNKSKIYQELDTAFWLRGPDSNRDLQIMSLTRFHSSTPRHLH